MKTNLSNRKASSALTAWRDAVRAGGSLSVSCSFEQPETNSQLHGYQPMILRASPGRMST